jgi:hypothetical protein
LQYATRYANLSSVIVNNNNKNESELTMKSTKQQLIAALRSFISQRSGIEYANYRSGDWQSSRAAFMGDYRPIIRHGKHARTMLRAVELRDSITAKDLIEASRAYSGRLQFVERDGGVSIEYTTGQYFPTEYRNAACAVLASALWRYWQPDCKTGDEIRKQARREFGRAIAATWFN